MSKYEVFSVPYFLVFGLNTGRDTPYLSLFSPNAEKYGPEKTTYLDTVYAVNLVHICPYMQEYVDHIKPIFWSILRSEFVMLQINPGYQSSFRMFNLITEKK